jgi:hypothetical protein
VLLDFEQASMRILINSFCPPQKIWNLNIMCGNRQYIDDQREFNREHDTDNMPRESTRLFHHLLYLYVLLQLVKNKEEEPRRARSWH